MAYAGVLICFEGGEGSGKSTLAGMLAEALKQEGLEVVLKREPGGTELGEAVRRILLGDEGGRPTIGRVESASGSGGQLELSPLEEFLLFSVARARLVQSVILPALTDGKVVILDRYFYSSYAYQGGGGGLDIGWMKHVTSKVIDGAIPDIIFYLDVPPELGLKRAFDAGNFRDRFQNRDISFHERVRETYLKLAKEEDKNFVVVDASQPLGSCFALVMEMALTLLKEKNLINL